MRTGAFAERVTVHASQVVAIPKDVPLDAASLLACGVITGLGAVINTAQVPAGAEVVVIGTGGVGLNSVQGAALRGARTIVAVDLSDSKLAAARRFGATHALNPATRGPARGRARRSPTAAARTTCSSPSAPRPRSSRPSGCWRAAARSWSSACRPSGVITGFDPSNLAGYGQRVLGSKMGSARIRIDVPMLVDLYRQGRLKLDELISGRYPLEEINAAIASVRRGEALRNVIVF